MTVVISIIVGFSIYFNNPGLNQAHGRTTTTTTTTTTTKRQRLDCSWWCSFTELKFEKNYANVKSSAQPGINRPVTAAGMVEENHTMTTTMKLNASISAN